MVVRKKEGLVTRRATGENVPTGAVIDFPVALIAKVSGKVKNEDGTTTLTLVECSFHHCSSSNQNGQCEPAIVFPNEKPETLKLALDRQRIKFKSQLSNKAISEFVDKDPSEIEQIVRELIENRNQDASIRQQNADESTDLEVDELGEDQE